MKWQELLKQITKFDWLLFAPAFLLSLIGMATLYSQQNKALDLNAELFSKQMVFLGAGMILMFVFAAVNFRSWRTYGVLIYILSIILLIAVSFWGTTIRGTTGWFYVFGFGIQPAEFAKLALVVALALIYNKNKGREKNLRTIILTVAVTLIPVVLTLLQPDFGSAAVMLGIGVGFYALAGMNKKHLLWIILGVILLGVVTWNFILLDYQQDRILTFLNPARDPLGRGYNVRQSIIAVGSGQITGRGLGLGTQSQLRFLPETSTDFIFAAISESLGFLGSGIIIVLFFILILKMIVVMKKARSNFGMYLVYGFAVMIFIHAAINIGMNIGIMPVTGISLPFVSYGGSFLLTCLVSIGVAESVSLRSN